MASYYCSRELALDFIYSKTGNSYEYKSNYELDTILERVVGNPDYSFLIISDDDIDYMPKSRRMIGEYSLNYITKNV